MLALSGSQRSCWLTLLCYASMNGKEGIVKHLSEHALLVQSGIDIADDEFNKTKGVLKKLENLDMITLDNDTIVINHWRNRQEMALTGYERIKRYRNKNKIDNDDNGNDNVRIDDNDVDNIRIEEKRIEEKRGELASEQSSQITEIFTIFKKINPTINYGNKTQRSAVIEMIKKIGFEKIKNSALYAVSVQGQPYTPTITTPYQLKEKLAALLTYYAKEKNKFKTNIIDLDNL